MRRTFILTALIVVVFLMSGCAPGPNDLAGSPSDVGELAGIWKGIWHGFISLFTFIISLFNDRVTIYEVHNNGSMYNLGFLLGIMLFYGGSGGGAGRKKR